MTWMTGADAELVRVTGTADDAPTQPSDGNLRTPAKWVAQDKPSAALRADPAIPTSHLFSEGNGGESRRSFHGYPAGYAQLLHSPQTWHITPMQIDTRDRKCGVTPADVDKCTDLADPSYVRPPEPKQARYGRGVPTGGSAYSGVLECPCNSRYGGSSEFYPTQKTQIVKSGVASLATGTCSTTKSAITSASKCFATADDLGLISPKTVTVDDATQPAGCSLSVAADAAMTQTLTFNSHVDDGSLPACVAGKKRAGTHRTVIGVTAAFELERTGKPTFLHTAKGRYCISNHVGVLKQFQAANVTAAGAGAALAACEAYCATDEACNACSVDCDGSGGSACTAARWVAIPACGKQATFSGIIAGDISLKSYASMARSATKGTYCGSNHVDVLQTFVAASVAVADARAALSACEEFCALDGACQACSVDCMGFGSDGKSCVKAQWAALPACGDVKSWQGLLPGDISTKHATGGGNATVTLSGPAEGWFGVGLDAQNMADSPYTFIVNSTGVSEQKIGTCGSEAEHCAGESPLAPSIDLLSSSVAGGVRTVVLRRPLAGLTQDHFTFDLGVPTIPFISAIGNGQTLAYHKAHAQGAVTLSPVDGAPTCVCDAGVTGSMCHTNGTSCDAFVKNCNTQVGGLLQQHNPTCDSAHYSGGLHCCGNGRIMLDADQDPGTELLRYHMKFRFWFQEYVPHNSTKPAPAQPAGMTASHNNLPRYYWQTEANAGEYDVPPAFVKPGEHGAVVGYPGWPEGKPTPGTTCTGTCPDGPDCECEHEITYSWTSPGMRLLYAGAHCHAPSCLSMKLWRNGTGTPELVCEMLPTYGGGNVSHDKYDESGYLACPPCLWGDDSGSEGLNPSFFIPKGEQVFSVKRNNNTHVGHFGEMASW